MVHPNKYNPRMGADGFYNASGADTISQAQKNVNDAQKVLSDAQRNLSTANTQLSTAVTNEDKARREALDCDFRRSQHSTGAAKNKACSNRDALYGNWGLTEAELKKNQLNVASATQAVNIAKANLAAAQTTLSKVSTSDPSVIAAQINSQKEQNVALAQINAASASSAKSAEISGKNRKTLYIVIGAVALVGIAIFAVKKIGTK